MERIASFTVDHDVLVPGLYLSRRDGSVTTFDLRRFEISIIVLYHTPVSRNLKVITSIKGNSFLRPAIRKAKILLHVMYMFF